DPLIVAGRLVPAAPEEGVIPVMIGPDVTVKPLNAGDVPAAVVTVKVRVSVAAPAAIVTVIGRLVAVAPVPVIAVTPLPLKLTAVAPDRKSGGRVRGGISKAASAEQGAPGV